MRAFRLAFGVTGISDDCLRNTIGAIVIGLETPHSAGENFGCTWEHLGAPTTRLGAPGSAGDKSWSHNNKSGSACNKSGSAGEKSVSTSNHSRAVFGKTTSSLRPRHVR